VKDPIKMEIMSIVHGQSEYRICSSIKSNLRLKHAIIARNKGKTSIQITSIMDILNDQRFKSFKNFIREFDDVSYKKNKLFHFSLLWTSMTALLNKETDLFQRRCSEIIGYMNTLYQFITIRI